jgi:hypothetical protein
MAEAKTSARRVDAAERRRKALQLRLAGASFDQIARTRTSETDQRPMYSSRKRAHEAVQTALKEIAEESRGSAEELRTLELARLEAMQMAVWPSTRPSKQVNCDNCGHVMWREPVLEAMDRVLKIMERRAKYLGLDVKGIEQDHSKAASMITSILDALEEGVPDEPAPAAGADASPDQ